MGKIMHIFFFWYSYKCRAVFRLFPMQQSVHLYPKCFILTFFCDREFEVLKGRFWQSHSLSSQLGVMQNPTLCKNEPTSIGIEKHCLISGCSLLLKYQMTSLKCIKNLNFTIYIFKWQINVDEGTCSMFVHNAGLGRKQLRAELIFRVK